MWFEEAGAEAWTEMQKHCENIAKSICREDEFYTNSIQKHETESKPSDEAGEYWRASIPVYWECTCQCGRRRL